MPDETFDTIVIGAGPAGTSAASVLAEKGRRVALLERDPFPRYRVGESLIPWCWFPLQRLGLIECLEGSSFVVNKHSVQFASLDGQLSTPFYFFEHTDHPCATTWQVVRSEFDQLLLDGALHRGARFFPQTAAKELIWDNGAAVGVRAQGPDGEALELRAPLTIDATGRDTFSQARNRWRVPDRELKKVAIWTYYEGGMRDEGIDAGATTIAYVAEKGWFWYIPLAGDRISVGVVADGDYLYRDTRDPEQIFLREVASQPWIERHLAPGRPTGEFQVTSDFSYRSRHCATDGLVLCGDAFAFLDPVFSSGVFLALHTGVLAGDAAEAALARGDVSASNFEEYGAEACRDLEAFRRLVYAFYDAGFNFASFLKDHPDLRDDVTDCLIGNLKRDFEPLFETMGRYANVPAALEHGTPLTTETAP